jgi:hypothetical protein
VKIRFSSLATYWNLAGTCGPFEGSPLRNLQTPVSLNLLEPAWNLQPRIRDMLEPIACVGETRHLLLWNLLEPAWNL